MERDALVQTVAENIRALMDRRDMNASELARAAGVNPTGVYDILSGKSRSPRLDTVHKIAVALKVPVSQLFEQVGTDEARDEIVEIFLRLDPVERRRLLQAARSWLPAGEKSA